MISIVIPTYNESVHLPQLLKHLEKSSGSHKTEIIVCDGGSTDGTPEIAMRYRDKVKLIRAERKNRAYQMNLGAEYATGEILYFLHADTRPPKSFVADIEKSVKQGFHFGCYRLAFDENHPLLNFYCWFTRFDFDFFRFGDQSLFLKKEIFFEAGMFDDTLPLMEDQEIYCRLREKGKFRLLEKEVCTSARKYRRVGLVKLQLLFTTIFLLYYAGVDRETLIDFYIKTIRDQPY